MKKFRNYFQDQPTSSVNFSHFRIRNAYHFKVVFLDLSWIWRFVVNSRNLRRWFHGNIIVWPLRNLQKLHDASKNGPVGAYFFSLWLQNRHLSTIGKLFYWIGAPSTSTTICCRVIITFSILWTKQRMLFLVSKKREVKVQQNL